MQFKSGNKSGPRFFFPKRASRFSFRCCSSKTGKNDGFLRLLLLILIRGMAVSNRLSKLFYCPFIPFALLRLTCSPFALSLSTAGTWLTERPHFNPLFPVTTHHLPFGRRPRRHRRHRTSYSSYTYISLCMLPSVCLSLF